MHNNYDITCFIAIKIIIIFFEQSCTLKIVTKHIKNCKKHIVRLNVSLVNINQSLGKYKSNQLQNS